MRLLGVKATMVSVARELPRAIEVAAAPATDLGAISSWSPPALGRSPLTLKAVTELTGPTAAANTAEWMRVSVRDPAEAILDAAYLQRAHDSVSTVFAPWLSGQGETTFEAMLRAQHRVLVAGLEGTDQYAGASRREHNQATGYRVAPGVLMTEVFPPEGEVKFAFHRPSMLKGDESPQLRALAELYPATETLGREFVGKTPDALHSPFASSYRLTLPRVPEHVAATNEVVGDYLTHVYPRVGDLPLILKAMGETLDDVRALQAAGEATPDQLVHLLAEYTYLAANAHFATGANFSLAMSQVNHVLERFGLRASATRISITSRSATRSTISSHVFRPTWRKRTRIGSNRCCASR